MMHSSHPAVGNKARVQAATAPSRPSFTMGAVAAGVFDDE
jgi:hypothetical protein